MEPQNADDEASETERAGLCAKCRFARRIESARGSKFILCELSASDPAFPKYPRLPVIECPGYVGRVRGYEKNLYTRG
ncbi:MAG TPA: hypothetical protein VGR97_03595 [Candidatus Acidoferrales bacterium]|nr:hypothetical protein [Candidatus Acidoferrales bacterium]